MKTGNVQLTYKDPAGAVQETELAMARTTDLAGGQPWRRFRWHHGQAHYSGWYWSATMGKHVVYESRLELARLLLADFDPRVVSIAAQPFHITEHQVGRTRRHVPDYLLLDQDGLATVVNVKPADLLAKPKIAAALEWAGTVFADRGWRHEIWSSAPTTVLANVRFLAAYRHRDRVAVDVLARVEDTVGEPVSLDELEAFWPRQSGEVRAAALHLLWRGVFRADLSSPLSGSTMLGRAA
ncbi:TnsA-like heteromeric transposase endonuclease subunit [Amycolatopsis sp. H20-H5]|uniref:TnsA-like heteromeric transposase endonuclease subunit n=1 Tax=Amycolatopsis sp. H20-H5 TaxID=3046309 RepID=UPI002DC02B86|nr:TnsA-like heteromeric transposase endonuclease subunit [Amycolatopsis sp. H20-H5]MEC3974928.1 TnsA-like heteromeric transposase endonuclease subunit [Amycolatopsis sp. H20-H5]